MLISVVCHENIARSQVLGHYLEYYLSLRGLDDRVTVFSCGTVLGPATIGNEEKRLAEVQERLRKLRLSVIVRQNWWNEATETRVRNSDIILAADTDRRVEIVERLGSFITSQVSLFYEFIGEGVKDFADTFDSSSGAQDPMRFDKCFAELERIGKRVVEVIAEKHIGAES